MSGIILSPTSEHRYVDCSRITDFDGAADSDFTVCLTIAIGAGGPVGGRICGAWGVSNTWVVVSEASGVLDFCVASIYGFLKSFKTSAAWLTANTTTRIAFKGHRGNDTLVMFVDGASRAIEDWFGDANIGDGCPRAPGTGEITTLGYNPADATAGEEMRCSQFAVFHSELSDQDCIDYSSGAKTPAELAGAPGTFYIPMLTSGDMTDLWGAHAVVNHGGTWDAGTTGPPTTPPPTTIPPTTLAPTTGPPVAGQGSVFVDSVLD